jgi:Mg2+ and Co2+ transporter CorA
MTEHIELLKKEIAKLERNLDMAKKRSGAKLEEIQNIQKKLLLKYETVAALVAWDSFREGEE